MSGLDNHETQLDLRPPHPDAPVRASDMLKVIADAVANPAVDVEKMSRLLDMHERILADQRKTAYVAAMARLQGRMPQITKDGRIVVNGQERSRYARLEDIDAAIRPLLTEEGFSISYDEDPTVQGGQRLYSGKVAHREGHCETKHIMLPLDTTGSKNAVQSIGSTYAYARRYLLKAHFNLVERGEDIDGHQLEPINSEQLRDIETAMQDTKASQARFLKHFGIAEVKDLLQRDYATAMQMLETKRRTTKKEDR